MGRDARLKGCTVEERAQRVMVARDMIRRIDMTPQPGEPNLSRADVFAIVQRSTSREKPCSSRRQPPPGFKRLGRLVRSDS